jgi:hypothetical protein
MQVFDARLHLAEQKTGIDDVGDLDVTNPLLEECWEAFIFN